MRRISARAVEGIVAGDRLLVVNTDYADQRGWLVDPMTGDATMAPPLEMPAASDWMPVAWTGSEAIVWVRDPLETGPIGARFDACE